MSHSNWFEVSDTSNLISPSLLVYPNRIEKNIAEMKSVVGEVSRLRPHIKTHKTAEIVRMQMREGIHKFKCATIAEAELLGRCEAEEVVLAMPLVAANTARFVALIQQFPHSRFSTLVDNPKTLQELGAMALKHEVTFHLWMDINVGMNRTGIVPDDTAVSLFREIEAHPQLEAMGFHVYDGHIRESDFDQQKEHVDQAYRAISSLKDRIEQEGISVKTIIAGGSPSFPVHALRKDVDVAPGTTLLWDARYGELFPHMRFLQAAVLFTRIISKPAPGILCFDIGHKSIAPEMDFPRVRFLNLPDSEQVGQSEEHLVVKVPDSNRYQVGQGFYALPMHVCPTVAKYETLQVVQEGHIVDQWKVAARNQKITI